MLVKINSGVFVLASDVIAVKKVSNRASDNFGKWTAVVKQEYGTITYLVADGEENLLVSDINKFLEK
jgi:hypothetical protein